MNRYSHPKFIRFIHRNIHNFQSPPWIFINYIQQREDDYDTNSSSRVAREASETIISDNDGNAIMIDDADDEKFLNKTKSDNKRNMKNKVGKKKLLVVSGRDDVLLKLLAEKMNFKFEYIDVKVMELNENVTKPGALGLQMLQRRVIRRLLPTKPNLIS